MKNKKIIRRRGIVSFVRIADKPGEQIKREYARLLLRRLRLFFEVSSDFELKKNEKKN